MHTQGCDVIYCSDFLCSFYFFLYISVFFTVNQSSIKPTFPVTSIQNKKPKTSTHKSIKKSINFHNFNLLKISLLILLIELTQQLILAPHFLWHLREQMEDKVLEGFLWSIDY